MVEMSNTSSVVLIFTHGRWSHGRSPKWWQLLRIARRNPRRFRVRLCQRVLAWCTRSEWVHVIVSDGQVAADLTSEGVRFWPVLAFAAQCRGPILTIDIPIRPGLRPMPLSRWHGRGPVWVSRIVRARLTGARTFDCVDAAVEHIRQCGHRCPTLRTPAGLARWLIAQGFHHERIT